MYMEGEVVGSKAIGRGHGFKSHWEHNLPIKTIYQKGRWGLETTYRAKAINKFEQKQLILTFNGQETQSYHSTILEQLNVAIPTPLCPTNLIHSHFITAREQVKIDKLALDLGMIRLELMTQNIIPMRQNVQLGTTNAKQVFYCDTSTQALVHTLTDMHQITHSPTCKMLT